MSVSKSSGYAENSFFAFDFASFFKGKERPKSPLPVHIDQSGKSPEKGNKRSPLLFRPLSPSSSGSRPPSVGNSSDGKSHGLYEGMLDHWVSKKWQRRFCVLSFSGCLLLYRCKGGIAERESVSRIGSKSDILINRIDLRSALVKRVMDSEDGMKNEFMIDEHVFRADTEEESKNWMKWIKKSQLSDITLTDIPINSPNRENSKSPSALSLSSPNSLALISKEEKQRREGERGRESTKEDCVLHSKLSKVSKVVMTLEEFESCFNEEVGDENVDLIDKSGRTLLHISVSRDASEIVRFLIRKKAKRNLRDKNGILSFQIERE